MADGIDFASAGARPSGARARPEIVHYSLGDTAALSVHLRPTDLVNQMERVPLDFAASPALGRRATLRMILRLVGYLFRIALRKTTGAYRAKQAAEELRGLFESFGGLWVKLGQLISLRSDMLSKEFCDEMDKLQYRAVGFSPEQSVAIIEQELQRPIDEVFESFAPIPFAAASISQIHLGRLRKNGVDVVVKVLRPGARRVFQRDFRVLRLLARMLNVLPSVKLLDIGQALDELTQIIEEETDFRYEAANMRRMRKIVKPSGIVVPRVFRKLSGASVLVSECVWGVLMSDYIRINQADPARARAWCDENDIEPEMVGERLFLSFLQQLMEENFFHADMHPGNLILLRNSRVALIDFGSVGTVDKEFLTIYRAMLRALGQKDFSKAVDLQLRLVPNLRHRGLQELKQELIRHYRIWSGRAAIDSLPYNQRNVLASSNEAGRIMFQHGVTQSWDLLALGRTWATLDASLNVLMPKMNYLTMFKKYFRAAGRRSMRHALSAEGLQEYIAKPILLAQEYNMMLAPLMRKRVLAFQATASKLSRVGAIFARLLQVGLAVGFVVLVYNFLVQEHVAGFVNRSQGPLMRWLPQLDVFWWVVLLAVVALLVVSFRRVRTELMARDE